MAAPCEDTWPTRGRCAPAPPRTKNGATDPTPGHRAGRLKPRNSSPCRTTLSNSRIAHTLAVPAQHHGPLLPAPHRATLLPALAEPRPGLGHVGLPFCARPSGSGCSGRGGGVQAAGSQALSSWRRRASLGATPVAQCARTPLLSTVKNIQRSDFPTRRAAAARAAPSTPRLVSAARVGPVVCGLRSDAMGTADATS